MSHILCALSAVQLQFVSTSQLDSASSFNAVGDYYDTFEPAIDFFLNPIVVMLLAALFLIGIAYMGSAQRAAEREKLLERGRAVGLADDGLDEEDGEQASEDDSDEDDEESEDDSEEEDGDEDEDTSAGVTKSKKTN